MEAEQVDDLPTGVGWQFEPKWDGFRCIGVRNGRRVHLISKSGKPLGRYFPEIEQALKEASIGNFVIDGELCIPIRNELSFEHLQMRLHPAASRVAKLSHETPALFILFDLLAIDGVDLVRAPLTERRAKLEAFFADLRGHHAFRLSPTTASRAQAKRWLSRAGGGALDGVVAKRIDEPYRMGERAMLKIKCLRTADCVVGGFRYATGSKLVGSLLLGLYNESGKLDHVGLTSVTLKEASTVPPLKRRR